MGQKGALTGAALGTGIAAVAGGSFGAVVGAGLIGGAVGYSPAAPSATSNGGHDAKLSSPPRLTSIAGRAARRSRQLFDQAAYITCKEAHAMNAQRPARRWPCTWPSMRPAIAV